MNRSRTGESGIGKTSLAEEFLAELRELAPATRLATGRCLERLVDREAYLPILDILDELTAGPAGARVA